MVKKIEKIEFASIKKDVCSTKQEVNIPLKINIAKGGVKSQVFKRKRPPSKRSSQKQKTRIQNPLH
jgi:hypothetical protein